MIDFFAQFPAPAEVLTAAAWHAAAATALAAGVWVLTRLWRNPHAGRPLWGAVLLKLLCPPLLAVAVGLPAVEPASATNRDRQGAVPSTTELPATAADPVRSWNRDRQGAALSTPTPRETPPVFIEAPPTAPAAAPFSPARTEPLPHGRGSIRPAATVLTVWLAGTIILWTLAAARAWRFCRRVRRLPDAGPDLTARLAAAAALMNVPPPRLKVSQSVGPLAWAAPVRFGRFRRPAVVVPGELLNALPADAAEALLAHECAHLARRDELWRCAELAACGLWWWLPTAWLAASAGRRREELCCDAAVLRARRDAPDPAGPLAAALLAAAEFLHSRKASPVPTPASGAGRPGFLKERFTMICQNNIPARPGRWLRWPLAAAAVCLAAVGVTAGQEDGGAINSPDPAAGPDEPAPAGVQDVKDAVPLRDAVDAFNREHAAAAAEIGQPPLSPREIAEAYRKYEWGRERRSPDAGAADERETAAWERFSAVVRDRILPPGVSLRPRLTPRRTDDAKTIVDYQVDLIFAEPDRDVPVGFILRQAKGVRPATDEETVRGPELDGGYAAFDPVANVAAAPAEGDTAPESIPVESVDPAPGEPVTMWENTIVGVNLGADGPAREIASADESVCLAVPDQDNDALVVVRATGPGTTIVTYTAAKTGPGRFRVTVRPAEEFEAEPLADPIGPTLAEAVAEFNADAETASIAEATGGPVTEAEVRGRIEEFTTSAAGEAADALRAVLRTGRLPAGAGLAGQRGDGRTAVVLDLGAERSVSVREVGPTIQEAIAAMKAQPGQIIASVYWPKLTADEVRAAARFEADRLAAEKPYANAGEHAAALAAVAETGRLPAGGGLLAYRSGGRPVSVGIVAPRGDGGGATDALGNVRRDGFSVQTWHAVRSAVEKAAADDDLPVETRLKLLRETATPGTLTAEQTAWLFAALDRTVREMSAAADDGGIPFPLSQQFDGILQTMADFRVVAPDAATALELSSYRRATDQPNAPIAAVATVLKNTAATAGGLRTLLEAAALPKSALPAPLPRGGGGYLPVSPAERHEQGIAAQLDAVRTARPTTDEAAQVLLEAAASDDAAVRAAAVEALAGAGG